jgi:small subunit ribosomal protein S21
MLIIKVLPGENIDRALKRYKRKVRNVKLLNELRDRKEYKKPSKIRRETIKKARYKQDYLHKKESE